MKKHLAPMKESGYDLVGMGPPLLTFLESCGHDLVLVNPHGLLRVTESLARDLPDMMAVL